jgi:hypothetical protein
MPKVYIHVGAGKTGTSYLQAQCTLQHEYLAENGLWYPTTDQLIRRVRLGKVTSGNIADLLPWFCPRHNTVITRNLSFTSDQLDSWIKTQIAFADGRDILLSSETLQFANPERIQKFVDIVLAYGYDAVVIFYGRHALDHSISNYREHLQQGLLVKTNASDIPSINTWISKNVVPFAHTLNLYSKILPDTSIIVKSYDYARRFLLNDFMGEMNIDNISESTYDQERSVSSVVNRSLTIAESLFLEIASGVLDSDQVAFIGSLLIATPACDAALNGPRTFKISSDSLKIFEARHSKMISDINQKWTSTLKKPLEVIPKGFANDSGLSGSQILFDLSLHTLSLCTRPNQRPK